MLTFKGERLFNHLSFTIEADMHFVGTIVLICKWLFLLCLGDPVVCLQIDFVWGCVCASYVVHVGTQVNVLICLWRSF